MDLTQMTDGELAALVASAGAELERRKAVSTVETQIRSALLKGQENGLTPEDLIDVIDRAKTKPTPGDKPEKPEKPEKAESAKGNKK